MVVWKMVMTSVGDGSHLGDGTHLAAFFNAAPELVYLSDCELGRIVVLGHVFSNVTEFHVIGRGRRVLLRCIVVD